MWPDFAKFRPRFSEIAQGIAKQEGVAPLSKDDIDWLWELFIRNLYLDKREKMRITSSEDKLGQHHCFYSERQKARLLQGDCAKCPYLKNCGDVPEDQQCCLTCSIKDSCDHRAKAKELMMSNQFTKWESDLCHGWTSEHGGGYEV